MEKVADLTEVQQRLAPIRIPSTQYYPTPTFYIRGPGALDFGIPPWLNSNVMSEAHTLLDNVTQIIGKHTLKTGFVYRLDHAAWDSTNPTFLNFSGELVNDPITQLGGVGGGLAQFQMGAVGPFSSTGLWNGSYMRWRYWGAYLQDDIRITPRFGLNVGLRWDLYGWIKTRWQPMSNFCLGCPNPVTGLKGKAIYEGDPEFSEGHDLYPANKNNFGPRFNFSWAPFQDQKTILRGGYNIFTSNAANAANFPGQFTAPGWQVFADWSRSFFPHQCADFLYQCVAFPLSDTSTEKGGLTVPALTGGYPAQKRDPLLRHGFSFNVKPRREPLVQMWGLEVERELPGNLMMSVGYVGNHGTHLFGGFQSYNYVHTADRVKYRTAIDAQIPITDVYSGQTAAKLEEAWGSPVLSRRQLLVDYPFFSRLQSTHSYDGTSIYHGMNLRVQKKYSHGLNFVQFTPLRRKSLTPSTLTWPAC
jgi:hypothetical protein